MVQSPWEQIDSMTKEGWAVERLSLELRKSVFPTYLTHSLKCGSQTLQVSFLKVFHLSDRLSKQWLETENPTSCCYEELISSCYGRYGPASPQSVHRDPYSSSSSPQRLDYTSDVPTENPTSRMLLWATSRTRQGTRAAIACTPSKD